MFYVSRAVHCGGRRGCYVIDTDDGVEEFVPVSQLGRYYDLGVEIKGVTRTFISTNTHGYWKYDFEPCIPGRSAEEAKSAMLRGITYALAQNGDLIDLSVNPEFCGDVIEINLGDYSSVIGNWALRDIQHSGKTTILIIDNRVKEIYSKAFDNIKYSLSDIRFDIRDCQNKKAVLMIYNFVAKNAGTIYPDSTKWASYISDIDVNRHTRLVIEHTIFTIKEPVERLDTYMDDIIIANKEKILVNFLTDAKKVFKISTYKKPLTLGELYEFLRGCNTKNPGEYLRRVHKYRIGIFARGLGVAINRFSQVCMYLASGGRNPQIIKAFREFASTAQAETSRMLREVKIEPENLDMNKSRY